MSAMKAGMSRKTAAKYLNQDNVMEQRQESHTWRTREDPLTEIWPNALEMLREAPELKAKALFEHLMPKDSGKVKEKHLRTFQHRDEEGSDESSTTESQKRSLEFWVGSMPFPEKKKALIHWRSRL